MIKLFICFCSRNCLICHPLVTGYAVKFAVCFRFIPQSALIPITTEHIKTTALFIFLFVLMGTGKSRQRGGWGGGGITALITN